MQTPQQTKPTVRYRTLVSCQVGKGAVVLTVDHPLNSNVAPLQTSPVRAYDKNTGTFETQNTRYVPGPFANWPHGQDCAVKPKTAVPAQPVAI